MSRRGFPSKSDNYVPDAERRACCDWSEYSWGKGLVPKAFEDKPPSEGGMYKGLTPPADLIIGA
jgi:hypothetical protein